MANLLGYGYIEDYFVPCWHKLWFVSDLKNLVPLSQGNCVHSFCANESASLISQYFCFAVCHIRGTQTADPPCTKRVVSRAQRAYGTWAHGSELVSRFCLRWIPCVGTSQLVSSYWFFFSLRALRSSSLWVLKVCGGSLSRDLKAVCAYLETYDMIKVFRKAPACCKESLSVLRGRGNESVCVLRKSGVLMVLVNF